MTIKVGDKMPSVTLMTILSDGPSPVTTDDLCKGRKVALFGVPGAYTPTCSAQHLPGFVAKADALKAKGIDTIACVSVNDMFVMKAWGENVGIDGKVTMLADGNGDLAKAMDIELDLKANGLGVRNRRFSMVVDDGVVSQLYLEEGGAFEVSSAEKMLENL